MNYYRTKLAKENNPEVGSDIMSLPADEFLTAIFGRAEEDDIQYINMADKVSIISYNFFVRKTYMLALKSRLVTFEEISQEIFLACSMLVSQGVAISDLDKKENTTKIISILRRSMRTYEKTPEYGADFIEDLPDETVDYEDITSNVILFGNTLSPDKKDILDKVVYGISFDAKKASALIDVNYRRFIRELAKFKTQILPHIDVDRYRLNFIGGAI